ncbi:CocE/NonD family hydrolase [Paracoccus salsus]|uniref:CocE/NonD family hydrolase n=1 Tax=Paracoccus salsus TaxID=2911061 RepID=UPI001F33619E|nr:CocE/NonD family hydrolase [Paracoccus salsus]MCF3974654.1 CocE/NonD family hydrolase [Paracoccus salsus]
MKIDHPLPATIREIEHTEIAMPDGTRLAARIWMPEGSDATPVPAILEYIPYRKNDKTLTRDHSRAPWIAARGYAYVRVDLRGAGESEGVMTDEYTPIELQDGCDVIAWIADQAWCDGKVGIVGISWGGFNGLQLAALQPPALKAVVSICSTDDRYADDIHYMGGTLLCEQLSWASVMFGINTLPPDPAHVGARWREMWLARLTNSGLWLKNWLEHQTRDDFWKHGSICEDYADIRIPVYAVSGWADGYCRSVFRLVENLPGPVKGLVGPWSHRYPHVGVPGPAIDWLTEEVRWWDQWLKGVDTGIMDEPPLRVFLQDHARPQTHYARRDGCWITEPAWPSPNITRTAFALGADGRLSDTEDLPGGRRAISSPLWVGRHGGKWCSYAHVGDQPSDQRRDDAGSLTFETDPLPASLHMVGDPILTLTFTADRPVAQVALRLVDVAPDGAATRVSYGLLNLTHRDSHEHPRPLKPGHVYTVDVPMKHVAQTFRAGHRIRLGLSTSYFPLAWPTPESLTLEIDTGQSTLSLPLRHDSPKAEPAFAEPRAGQPLKQSFDPSPRSEWVISEDADNGRLIVDVRDHEGAAHITEHGLTHSAEGVERYSILPDDPISAEGEVTWTHKMRRDDWDIRTETTTRLTSTASDFRIRARLRAWQNEDLVHEESWDEMIPRNSV